MSKGLRAPPVQELCGYVELVPQSRSWLLLLHVFFFSFCFVLFCTAGAGSVRSVLLYLLPRRLTDRRGRAVVGLQMKCWMTFLCSSNFSLLRKLRSETCRASLQQASMLCFCTPPTTSPPSSLLPSVFYCLISTFPLQCLFCPSLTTQQQHPSSGSLGRWHLQPVAHGKDFFCVHACAQCWPPVAENYWPYQSLHNLW